MKKFRIVLAVEAKDAEEAGAFLATLGASKHLQWDRPLHYETLEVELLEELSEAEREATVEAITQHIQRRREGPEFMARLGDDALVQELLKDGASANLLGPRTYFFILRGGGAEGQLTLHASSEVDFIAQLACEEFGGEPNGPGSLADAAFDVADSVAGAFYSIPELDTFATGFHSRSVPSAKILQLALRCSEEQATHLRALVERHQNGAPHSEAAHTYALVEQPSQGETEMIPLCPKCVSEDVQECAKDAPEPWCCGNCGARFEVPVEASS